jgi:hypothetical protein
MKELHVDPKVFGDLVDSPEDFKRVYDVFFTTIMLSFRLVDTAALGYSTIISTDEVKRRFEICARWFRTLRGELGYGLNRTLAAIPKALVCELTDQEYKPDETMRGYASTADALSRAKIIE